MGLVANSANKRMSDRTFCLKRSDDAPTCIEYHQLYKLVFYLKRGMAVASKIGLTFLALFFLELWVIIKVGSVIGGLSVIVLMIIAATYGVSLVRSQGIRTVMTLQQQMAQGQAPAETMLEGVALLLAGVLFIFPGFLSDIVALLLLQPQLRKFAIQWLVRQGKWKVYSAGGSTFEGESHTVNRDADAVVHDQKPHQGTTIDGEYEHKDDQK